MRLRAENERLRGLLGLNDTSRLDPVAPWEPTLFPDSSTHSELPSVDRSSPSEEKIALFRQLFAAREDIHAVRWENQRTGRSGWGLAVAGETTGDGFLAVFDSATRAVRCAAAMVTSAQAMGLPIRVGVNTGEIEFVGSDIRGIAVHSAARMLDLAGPNEVLVSPTTRDLLEGSDLILEEAGTHELKGLSGTRQVFRLVPRTV